MLLSMLPAICGVHRGRTFRQMICQLLFGARSPRPRQPVQGMNLATMSHGSLLVAHLFQSFFVAEVLRSKEVQIIFFSYAGTYVIFVIFNKFLFRNVVTDIIPIPRQMLTGKVTSNSYVIVPSIRKGSVMKSKRGFIGE